MLHRLLPLFLIVGLLFYLIFNFQSVKRNIAYRLHISGDQTTSCCNVDTISKTGDFDENANTAFFNNNEISYPKTSLAYSFTQSQQASQNEVVLGTTNSE